MKSDERAMLSEDISRGIEAEKLLNNPLLQSIVMSHKTDACTAFMGTGRTDDGGRRDAWQKAQGFIVFEGSLQQLVDAGKIAKKLLDESDRLDLTNNNPLG